MSRVIMCCVVFTLVCWVYASLDDPQILESIERSDDDCNPNLCGGIVYKCMLTGACLCNNIRTNKTCNKECSICLGYDYDNCCLCLDLCDPMPEMRETNVSYRSNLEFVKEPQPDLFESLTELPDPMGRWKVVTEEIMVNLTTDLTENLNSTNVPCTVAYLPDCMPFHKCKVSCTSMGAAALRWFHDGCCQCIGSLCPPRGFDRSQVHDCQLCNFNFKGEQETDQPIDT